MAFRALYRLREISSLSTAAVFIDIKSFLSENTLLSHLLGVAVIALAYLLGVKIIKKVFGAILKRKNYIHIKFLKSACQVILTIATFVALLLQFGATHALATSVITSSSLLLTVVGFAAQQSLNNVICGIMISAFKPFEVGQRIVLRDQNITGTVEDITLRHTVVRGLNNAVEVVPNSVMNAAVIQNSDMGGCDVATFLDFSIGYASDIDLAKKCIAGAVLSHPLVDAGRYPEGRAEVLLRELGESGIQLRVTVWTRCMDDSFLCCSQLRQQVKEAFDKNDIEIPYRCLQIVKRTESGENEKEPHGSSLSI